MSFCVYCSHWHRAMPDLTWHRWESLQSLNCIVVT